MVPIDQPDYQHAHPEQLEIFRFIQQYILGDEVRPDPAPTDYPRLFDELPANFHDDLHTKPEIQRAWRYVRNHEHMVGTLDRDDHDAWLRQLDYYAWLHQRLDDTLTGLLGTLDELGIYDDTTVIYTSDHGDACGSHGLRAKLPCVYEEVMGVPLIVKSPRVEAGRTTDALSTHVDLAHTILSLGGGDTGSLSGVSLEPALADPVARPRDAVFFAQDSAQSAHLASTRYAVRGFFDGETKYARYLRGGRRRPAGRDGRRGEQGLRRRLRRPGSRVVRDRRGSARAEQPGQRPRPSERSGHPVRPTAGPGSHRAQLSTPSVLRKRGGCRRCWLAP